MTAKVRQCHCQGSETTVEGGGDRPILSKLIVLCGGGIDRVVGEYICKEYSTLLLLLVNYYIPLYYYTKLLYHCHGENQIFP